MMWILRLLQDDHQGGLQSLPDLPFNLIFELLNIADRYAISLLSRALEHRLARLLRELGARRDLDMVMREWGQCVHRIWRGKGSRHRDALKVVVMEEMAGHASVLIAHAGFRAILAENNGVACDLIEMLARQTERWGNVRN